MVIRAHKIRLNPTLEQERYFYRAAGIARFTWNWALDEYRAAKERGEQVYWNELKRRFNQIKREQFPFVLEVTKCAPEQAFADLRQAINTYYQVKQQNPKASIRFPGYRKRGRKVGGFGLANDKFSVAGHTVHIPKLGDVNMAEPLRFSGRVVSGRVKYQAGHWYLTVAVALSVQPVGSTSGSVGIDFGLSRFATLSDGNQCETQACFRQSERKLRMLQRSLSRKRKGSWNCAKAKLKVARVSARIAHQRSDFLHKMTTGVVLIFAVVCLEDLNLKGLIRTRLAKSFSEAGIGEAIRQLGYKAAVVQKVDRFFPSSKKCHVCGYLNEDLTLSDRTWVCPQCETEHDRDLNAAINIHLEG